MKQCCQSRTPLFHTAPHKSRSRKPPQPSPSLRNPIRAKQKIEELTLRRDNQLEPLTTPEKKYQMILQIILPTLQKMLQFILKNPKIPANLKAELLAERKNL